jgi:hypothetical protein
MCSLIVIAVKGFDASNPRRPEFLSLDFLLATTNAAKALLQRRANTLAGGLIVINRLTVTVAGGHLDAGVANGLVVLQSLLDAVRWLALAFEIIWVVLLQNVSKCAV